MIEVKDLFTEKDGVSFCPLRSAFIVGFAAIIGFTTFEMFTAEKFTFLDHAADWMKGMAEYLGFGGGAIAGKNYTEDSGVSSTTVTVEKHDVS